MSEAAILEKESQTVKQTDLSTLEQFPTQADLESALSGLHRTSFKQIQNLPNLELIDSSIQKTEQSQSNTTTQPWYERMWHPSKEQKEALLCWVVKIQLGANCSALKTGKENGSVRENEQNQ
ncbi:MAG TPA: hypothetical protein PKZ32_18550 [Candidatus Melainabacteria bacterium]|nr:hypothetical protein [Candidatus Melainabacteria bacterium]